MSATPRWVAVVEHGGRGPDEQVLAAARALGDALGTDTALLAPGPDDPTADVLHALAADGVAGGVLSAHGDHPVLWQVVTRAPVPVLALPRGVIGAVRSVARVVVPLDGTPATAAAVGPLARSLLAAGADVAAVHVFDPSTAPAFWDHAGHSHLAFTEEFLRRHQLGGVRLDLRRGRPVVEVLSSLDRTRADLVLMAWGQDLSPGHADVVRHALLGASVPVLLVRAGPGTPPEPDAGPSALPPDPGRR